SPHCARRQWCERLHLDIGAAICLKSDPNSPWRICMADRLRNRQLHLFGRKRKSERLCRTTEPGKMQIAANEADLGFPPRRFDQVEAGFSPVAKRPFSRHSAYSPSAVESKTTPPPILNTARPSGKSEIVRMATLKRMLPSGAS